MSTSPNRLPNVPLTLDQRTAAQAINYLLQETYRLGNNGAVLPVVDGSVPPVFLVNSDGSLIYAPLGEWNAL